MGHYFLDILYISPTRPPNIQYFDTVRPRSIVHINQANVLRKLDKTSWTLGKRASMNQNGHLLQFSRSNLAWLILVINKWSYCNYNLKFNTHFTVCLKKT